MKLSFPFVPKPSKSIVTQLTNWYAFSLFVIILFASSYLYWTLSSEMTAENQAVLRDRMETISELVKKGPDAFSILRERIRFEWPSRRVAHVFVRILDAQGVVSVESPGLPEDLPQDVFTRTVIAPSDAAPIQGRKFRSAQGVTYLVYARRLSHQGSVKAADTVYLALDLSRAENILSSYRNSLMLVLLACLLLSVWLGRRWAITAFRPVTDVVEVTRRIRSTTLHERVNETNLPIELRQLASTINEMLDRLEEAFDRLSRFSTDIAHELRTPINNIRGEVEVALGAARDTGEYREVLGSCLEECSRVSKVIDSLLFLAKAEHPEMQIQRERINLKTEIANIVDFYEVSATEEELAIRISIPEDLMIQAERTLLQRAIGNLISNAIAYNRPGGTITLSAARVGEMAEIAIADTGEGISQTDLPLVFDRFYRADPSRKTTKMGGFGLGLTIVKTIVALHQGKVRIDSEPGRGTTVIVSFPTTA